MSNVWYRAGLRGYAQALTSKEEIAKVKGWSTAKLHELAEGQIKLAKDAFAKASDVAWYQGLYIRWINDTRWGPFLKQIQDAEESFTAGDKAASDTEKRDHYISAWTVARLAVSGIAKEAGFGETGFTYLAEDLGRALETAAQPYVKRAEQLGGDVLTALKWSVGITVALWVLQQTRR